jgi:hypothetical protein
VDTQETAVEERTIINGLDSEAKAVQDPHNPLKTTSNAKPNTKMNVKVKKFTSDATFDRIKEQANLY